MSKPTIDPTRAITQRDIARLVGCSQNTVALALRHSPRISQAKREEILRIANEHGYRPYIAARGLRQGRSGLIGLYGTIDPIRTDYVQNVMNQLHNTEYSPVLGIDFDKIKPWYSSPWIDTLLSLQVEAMVCFSWNDEPRLPPWHQRVPIVMCGFSHDTLKEPLPCDTISMDRHKAVAMAIDFLVRKGHRKISAFERHYGERVSDGYLLAMNKQGLEPHVIRRDLKMSETDFIKKFVADYKNGVHRPTALFVLPTSMAVELYFALTEAGIRVPQDIELVAYDRSPWIAHVPIPLTTVEQPVEEMTNSTIKVVLERLRNPTAPHQHIEHDLKLVVRK
jgi:LacI family transcriptional regulator